MDTYRKALRIVQKYVPDFKTNRPTTHKGVLSAVDLDTRQIFYGLLVRLGLKDELETLLHEMFHLVIYEHEMPRSIRVLFGFKDSWSHTQKFWRLVVPSGRAVTRYGETSPEEDLVEACRLVARGKDNFKPGTIQYKKCQAVRKWLLDE